MDAKYPIHLAIYLDVLTPLKVLSLGFQKEKHHTLSTYHRIQLVNGEIEDFHQLVDDNSQRLTYYTKLLKDMELTENGDHMHQDFPIN